MATTGAFDGEAFDDKAFDDEFWTAEPPLVTTWTKIAVPVLETSVTRVIA